MWGGAETFVGTFSDDPKDLVGAIGQQPLVFLVVHSVFFILEVLTECFFLSTHTIGVEEVSLLAFAQA